MGKRDFEVLGDDDGGAAIMHAQTGNIIGVKTDKTHWEGPSSWNDGETIVSDSPEGLRAAQRSSADDDF